MAMHSKLSEYLETLDFLGARNSRDYVGTKVDNPAMILEEHIPTWIKHTDLQDLQDCFKVFQDNVCVCNFPARYSPSFWLAHAALSTIYNVLSSFLELHGNDDDETRTTIDRLLFELWCRLISSGPGSSHLEMMDIILKHPHYPLWKYLQNISGENLSILISTLKTDFVYTEEVSADHYATLMETHIDKIFKVILSDRQMEEARRGMLDLCLFYLNIMNHVPPHIGPRLSHLCFLICNRYKMENPYMGYDDWVLLRHHMKTIKDVITNPTFTVASEAQYRAPLTLEKIFQAAVSDKMLDIMFKDFMTLLLTICNHDNSKKCKRLFTAYQTGLFELIDFKRDFETTPNWMFDQCIQTLGKLSKTIAMETHIDEFIISTQKLILEKFDKLSPAQISSWHELMVNYLVSGRTFLVKEAGQLLNSSILKTNNGLNWKTYIDQWKLFVDIISDIPGAFLQKDEDGTTATIVQEYALVVKQLLDQIIEVEFEGRVRQNVHQCLLHCLEKDAALKAPISLVCVQSSITDFTDTNFIRDVLFTVDALLRDPGCPTDDKITTDVILILLKECLEHFKSKGYVAVDLNSLFMSICQSCLSGDSNNDAHTPLADTNHVTRSCDLSKSCDQTDLWSSIYHEAVKTFLDLHIIKGTVRSIASLVPQTVLIMEDYVVKQGTIPVRCMDFLFVMSSNCFQLVSDHVTRLLNLFLDCHDPSLLDLLLDVYNKDDGTFLTMFQDIFDKTLQVDHEQRHVGMKLLEEISKKYSKLFLTSHVCQLLGTYHTESESTQLHILNIIQNIAKYNPGTVAPYFSILVDDEKFDQKSLPQRAPILKCLSQHSEELCQRSVDYMMKFVSNTDDDISTVAMETLFQLIKDKPTYIQKQKVKLKNLWKATTNTTVKDICAKLVPEILSMGKATTTKPVSKKSKTDNTIKGRINQKETGMGAKKTQKKPQGHKKDATPVLNVSQNVYKPATVSVEVKTDKEIPLDTQTQNQKENGEVAVAPFPSKIAQDDDKGLGVNETCNEKVPGTLEGIECDINEESHKPVINKNDIHNKDLHGDNDSDKAGGDTERAIVKTECIDNADENVKGIFITELAGLNNELDLVEKCEHHKVETASVKDGCENEKLKAIDDNMSVSNQGTMYETISKPMTEPVSNEGTETKPGSSNTDRPSQGSGNVTSETTEPGLKPKTELVSVVEPDVHLYGSAGSSAFIHQLCAKLKMAGYNNIVKDGNEDNDTDIISGAKVVILCCDNFDESKDHHLKKQMLNLEQNVTPLICVRNKQIIHSGSSSTQQLFPSVNHRSIRFYSKPGEEIIQGTDWPKYKFCELLMQLNYNGIRRDDKLLTKEFRSLWENRIDEKEKHLRKSFDDRSFLLPDIFVSYHWGKQRQVEPLYSHLMSEGLLCWMGAYQMDGSESLYNKTQQGLQSCRVVLACVTKKYEQSEICQCDIKTALKLGRVIIPVLIDDCPWPLGGEIGAILQESEPIKLKSVYNVQRGFLPSAMKKLISLLQHYTVTNRDDHVLEIPSEIRCDTIDDDDDDDDDDFDDDNDSSNVPYRTDTKVSKSSLLLEFKKPPGGDKDLITRRHSNAIGVRRNDNSESMWSDDEGYQMRTSRSKSCIIL